jgi:hypothetical protein
MTTVPSGLISAVVSGIFDAAASEVIDAVVSGLNCHFSGRSLQYTTTKIAFLPPGERPYYGPDRFFRRFAFDTFGDIWAVFPGDGGFLAADVPGGATGHYIRAGASLVFGKMQKPRSARGDADNLRRHADLFRAGGVFPFSGGARRG